MGSGCKNCCDRPGDRYVLIAKIGKDTYKHVFCHEYKKENLVNDLIDKYGRSWHYDVKKVVDKTVLV